MPAMAPVEPISSVGNIVTGAIEGKFEHGYLVSVVVGTERLRGVLYHIPPGPCGPQHAYVPYYTLPSRPEEKLPEKVVPETKRKRKQREHLELRKDPDAPRSSRTGYNFFFAEERAKIKVLYPDKEKVFSRMIGDAWNGLTLEQKVPYQERGARDRERYEKELREYKQLKSRQQAGSSALQAEVRPEASEVATASAGDGDYHVVAVEANPNSASTAVTTPRSFYRFQFPQPHSLVNSSVSALEQRGSSQQYPPQHFPLKNSLQAPTSNSGQFFLLHPDLSFDNVG